MKLIKYVIILIIPCLFSCNGNSNKADKSNDETTENSNNLSDADMRAADSIAAVQAMLAEENAGGEKINAFLDEYFSKHTNSFDNDIQRKKAGKELHALLKEKLKSDPNFLSDIPVELSSMDKAQSSDGKGYKYLISFNRSSLSRTGNYYISFKIITTLSEQDAANLKDNSKYYVKGDFVDFSEKKEFKIGLNVFKDKEIEIGGIFLKNPTVTPV